MTTKAYAVRGYVRSTPFAGVQEAKTDAIASELGTDEGWIEARSWHAADVCLREVKEDPDYQAVKDFFRYNIGGIV